MNKSSHTLTPDLSFLSQTVLLLEYCMEKVRRAEHRLWHATPGEGVKNRQEHILAIL
jgi:hypothetical protein